MWEMHEIPYSGHLGYHKTLKNIQRSFYWPEHTLDIHDFVLGCSVCQQEKAIHCVPAGLLQPLKLPKQKWADVSMDYIMGLPKSEMGNDGILTIIDRAIKMVHLAPVKQTIMAADTVRLYWNVVGKYARNPLFHCERSSPKIRVQILARIMANSGEFVGGYPMPTTHRQMVKWRWWIGW